MIKGHLITRDMTQQPIIDKVFQWYKNSGFLFRANDGQKPPSVKSIQEAITKINLTEDPPFSEILQNLAPPYSASLLSGINSPLLWYNFDYAEAFKGDQPNPMGKRTIVGVIFHNGRINVRGACVWDADSNLRNLGNIPSTMTLNRINPTSLCAQLEIFNGIATYKYSPPTSLNNHPFYNPLFLPRHINNIADTEDEVNQFLSMMGDYRKVWMSTLKTEADGQFNDKFGNYLNNVYQTGLETEVLVEPIAKESQPYYERKFDISDILCIGFFTDGKKPSQDPKEYITAAKTFLDDASDPEGGWINPMCAPEFPPVILVTGVALPNVPLSGTSTPKSNVGQEWVHYLTLSEFGYTDPLVEENFILLVD